MARILLIEDDLITQHVHKLMFDKLGHSVEIAESGFKALAILNTQLPYDIIFVDIGLPDMKGFDLIKKMREITRISTLPILALTGYIGNSEKHACFACGATEVIHKPILMHQMTELLSRYIPKA